MRYPLREGLCFFCIYRRAFSPLYAAGHVTWTRPSNQGASAVSGLSFRLRTGATARTLGRLRAALPHGWVPLGLLLTRSELLHTGTACTSNSAKADPPPNGCHRRIVDSVAQTPSVLTSSPDFFMAASHPKVLHEPQRPSLWRK